MAKGTPSFGKKNKHTHITCRRCGKHTYHASKKMCVACGFGKSSHMRKFSWEWKTLEGPRRK